MLNGFIKRKVIKQTVMTTVYGVTKFGARLQIVKQLKGNFIDFFYITVIKGFFLQTLYYVFQILMIFLKNTSGRPHIILLKKHLKA